MTESMWVRWIVFRGDMVNRRDRFRLTVARWLPAWLVYWAMIRASSVVIRGGEEVPAVRFMDVVKRWGDEQMGRPKGR